MADIDFLGSTNKDDQEKKAPAGDENGAWTSPPPDQQPDKSGWLAMLKGAVPVDGLKSGSRQEALARIKGYVDAREGQPVQPETEPVGSPAPSIPPAEAPEAARPAPEIESGNGVKKSSWLKFLFGKKTARPGKAREIAVLATDMIKGEIITFFDWKRNLMLLLFFIVLSLMILAGTYQALDLWEKSKQQQILNYTEKFKNLSIDIRQAEKDAKNILLMQKKLEATKALLAGHIYWTNFFVFLEENTLGNVFYSGFSGNNKGNYVLAATAKDFDTIAQQIKTLQANGLIRRAATAGGTASKSDAGGTVAFDLQLSLDPGLFNRK